MKQVLIYLVEFLKEQHGISMSEMSKGLGRGRNFIREAITRGYENEDKYVDIMNNLKFNFFYSNDDNEFYMFMAKKHHESISSYKDALKQSVESNLDEIEEKNKVITKQGETIRSLEHRITMLNKNIDDHEEYRKKSIRAMTKGNEISAKNDKLKNDLALQESLFLEKDLELRKYKKLADGKEQQVQSCLRALSSSKKEKAYLFGGFILLAILVIVILYLSFIHIAI